MRYAEYLADSPMSRKDFAKLLLAHTISDYVDKYKQGEPVSEIELQLVYQFVDRLTHLIFSAPQFDPQIPLQTKKVQT